jgi:CNT family concentrative nucleoside transporter
MMRQIVGYFVCVAVAYLLSCEKANLIKKQWKCILFGVILQIALVFLMTNVPIIISGLECVADGVMKLKDAALEGTKFVFGYIGGGEIPFEVKEGSNIFVFAFQALPTVILVSILSAILTYLRVIPYIAKVIGYVFKKGFGVRSIIGMVSAAKIFLGQFEAPLLIKNHMASLSKAEMFLMMSFAFSTSSASVMPIYATALSEVCPEAMTHIVISSVIGVISTLIVCIIMMPSLNSISKDDGSVTSENLYPDFMTAISKGTSDGAFVWWAVVGSLIGMVALIALVNYILGMLPDVGGSAVTLQRIFGIVMYPFAWILGIPSADILPASEIIGTKFVLNEIIAFFDMAKSTMSKEGMITTIYAITNFGNFACIGMTIGGLVAMCPTRSDIPALGFQSFRAGTLATGLTATLMGLFLC